MSWVYIELNIIGFFGELRFLYVYLSIILISTLYITFLFCQHKTWELGKWSFIYALSDEFSLVLPGVHWAACKMSMVLFASVVRVRDGLPLSASTDYEQDKGLQETKKHLKGLSKKLSQFPDRCSLRSGLYNIKWVINAVALRVFVNYVTPFHVSSVWSTTLEMH